MNEDLKYSFNNINEWLKFAEAKNAGLLAFNLASVIGILQVDTVFDAKYKFFEVIIVILLILSSFICLCSIVPVLNNAYRFYKKMPEPEFQKNMNELNALYFGDIAKLSANQFNTLFEHKHDYVLTKAEKDFGNQITNNAEICCQKYSLFNWGAWCSFTAFLFGAYFVIIKAVG